MKHFQAVCINKECDGKLENGLVCDHSGLHGVGEECYDACPKMKKVHNCALVTISSPGKPYKFVKLLGA